MRKSQTIIDELTSNRDFNVSTHGVHTVLYMCIYSACVSQVLGRTHTQSAQSILYDLLG